MAEEGVYSRPPVAGCAAGMVLQLAQCMVMTVATQTRRPAVVGPALVPPMGRKQVEAGAAHQGRPWAAEAAVPLCSSSFELLPTDRKLDPKGPVH